MNKNWKLNYAKTISNSVIFIFEHQHLRVFINKTTLIIFIPKIWIWTGNFNVSCFISVNYLQRCPTGYFTCQRGAVSCIDEAFKCDCENDCDDGSDESVSYATCDPLVLSSCPSGAPSKYKIFICIHRRISKLAQLCLRLHYMAGVSCRAFWKS